MSLLSSSNLAEAKAFRTRITKGALARDTRGRKQPRTRCSIGSVRPFGEGLRRSNVVNPFHFWRIFIIIFSDVSSDLISLVYVRLFPRTPLAQMFPRFLLRNVTGSIQRKVFLCAVPLCSQWEQGRVPPSQRNFAGCLRSAPNQRPLVRKQN